MNAMPAYSRAFESSRATSCRRAPSSQCVSTFACARPISRVSGTCTPTCLGAASCCRRQFWLLRFCGGGFGLGAVSRIGGLLLPHFEMLDCPKKPVLLDAPNRLDCFIDAAGYELSPVVHRCLLRRTSAS